MKNFNWFKIFCIIMVLGVISTTSCKKENRCDCIKRTGTIITETRTLNGFTQIYMETDVKVYVTQDTVFEVKVEAGENIVPLIKTEVRDSILYIRNYNRCNWTRSYKKPIVVYVKMPLITYITSDGVADIIGTNAITTPHLEVRTKNSGNIELIVDNQSIGSHMHGSGDLTLKGITGEHACDIGGAAFLKCKELQTKYTWVHTFTTGLCYVKSDSCLTCLIDNVGDVYCYGNPPSVNESREGSGQLYLK